MWVSHHSPPSAKNSVPTTPTLRWPTRWPTSEAGTDRTATIAGPGASIRPAVRIGSAQTVVTNRTVPSSITPKPIKKTTIATPANAKPRTLSSSGYDRGRMSRRAGGHRGDQQHRGREERDDPRGAPAPVGALDDCQGEGADASGEEGASSGVRASPGPVARLVQDLEAHRERSEHERNVHEEHEAPASLDEQTPDRRPRSGRGAARGRPDSDGDLAAVRRELRQQQGERGGEH